MEQLTKFDDTFLGILQHLGKIEPFLDAVFFFLARRTDFFQLMETKDAKMGFPPGIAEKIVMATFKKHQSMVLGEQDNLHLGTKKKARHIVEGGSKTTAVLENPPPVSHEVEVVTKEEPVESSQAGPMAHGQSTTATKSKNCAQKPSPSSSSERWSASDSYNGAVTEKYAWSQTSTDIDMKVPIPAFVKKSKDIGVEIKADSLKIFLTSDPLPGCGTEGRTILVGKLHKTVKCEESLWSLFPGDYLQVNLEKQAEVWWTCVLEGETEIDKGKIDTTKDIAEFDEQTQADFQRVVYDHHQKMQGKPTIQEQKTYDILKQAWDAEGSPFKGTPYDPSKVNISPSNG